MARRSALVIFLEPFVLLAVGLAALLFMIATLASKGAGRAKGRPLLSPSRVLLLCSVPCILAAILSPWLGPAALAGYFGISLVAIMRLR